jgi:uncharacterized protein with HEPN domain
MPPDDNDVAYRQRIVLAHRYSKIDHALLYKTTRESVPALIGELERLLEKGSRP